MVDEQGSVWKHAGATLEKSRVIESLIVRVLAQSRDGFDADHLAEVLHLCLTTPDDVAALTDALWQPATDEFGADFGAGFGVFLQTVCFGKGGHDEELKVLVLNRIDATLEEQRMPSTRGIPEDAVRAGGHLLSGFFDYSRSAADHPPRVTLPGRPHRVLRLVPATRARHR